MQPGKPQGFGTDRRGQHADLHAPGQPGERVRLVRGVHPTRCCARCSGIASPRAEYRKAVTTEGWNSPPGRRQYARGWYELRADGVGTVRPVGGQGSHLVGDLTESNCLVVVPEATSHVPPGARVNVLPLDDGAAGN